MEDAKFLSLSQLFDSIGVIEKGIERIYHYLLINKRIDNLKEICNQFNLSLKRGYKVCSVLSDLGLVQIYDRPMKIHLKTPPLDLWQDIIHHRIEDLQNQFQEKRNKCETALDGFLKKYKLDEQVSQEPVEFIKFDLGNLDESYHALLAKKECKIALGIRYINPLIEYIYEDRSKTISEEIQDAIRIGMNRIKENLEKIEIKVIFHSEVIKELLASEEYNLLTEHVEPFNMQFKNIIVRVTDENFSNFSLTDNELIQPSFDPTNNLIGVYISRNKSIYQIFYDKFVEIFENGVSLNDFIGEDKDITYDSLTETQIFVLCVM